MNALRLMSVASLVLGTYSLTMFYVAIKTGVQPQAKDWLLAYAVGIVCVFSAFVLVSDDVGTSESSPDLPEGSE